MSTEAETPDVQAIRRDELAAISADLGKLRRRADRIATLGASDEHGELPYGELPFADLVGALAEAWSMVERHRERYEGQSGRHRESS
jgi:hypothetical protein